VKRVLNVTDRQVVEPIGLASLIAARIQCVVVCKQTEKKGRKLERKKRMVA
jgi:hypothetical protein